MCGIGGFRRFGSTPITKAMIETMLVGLENRGNDATGVAIVNPGPSPRLHVFKGAQPAWNFVRGQGFEKWLAEHLTPETSIVLLHTRAATLGNPNVFENNHPMYNDDAENTTHSCAVIHNGVISNHEMLFNQMHLKRAAETDSDILRAILDQEGFTKKGIRELARVNGSVAMAAVDAMDPEHLLLVRSGSPLVVGCTEDMLAFASEKKYIHASMRPTKTRFGLDFTANLPPDFGWLTMADNSAWLFNEDSKEWHDECKTLYSTYNEPRRHVYEGYQERKVRWAKDSEAKAKPKADAAKSLVVDITDIGGQSRMPLRLKCPNTTCETWHRYNKDIVKFDPKKLVCTKCKTVLLTEARA